MKPAADLVLAVLAADIGERLAQQPRTPESALLFAFKGTAEVLARHADDAAAMRLDEIQELASLLRSAQSICPPDLGTQLRNAGDEADQAYRDITVSALDRVLDTLNGALIELQAWLETSPHTEAPTLLTQSWDFLIRANAKRLFFAKPW